MEKVLQPSSTVENVGIGQVATHNLRKGPFYHHLTYYVTVWKTAATAGFTSATLADALDTLEVRINTQARRTIKAIELDTIQTAWGGIFATVATDYLLNDAITIDNGGADRVNGNALGGANINGPGGVIPPQSTQRPTTFEFTIYFGEPWRKSYSAERFFGLPTSWATGKTVDVQVALKVPTPGYTSVPQIRCEEFIDFATGPHLKALANGKPDTTTQEVLPFVHYWRINKNYSATQFSITDWGNTSGKLQQISLFAQVGDALQKYTVKGDGTTKRDTTKFGNDNLNYRYDWGVGVYNANVTHIAGDVSDDVVDWFQFNLYRNFELALTLSQAAAGNKNIVAIVQAYDVITLP